MNTLGIVRRFFQILAALVLLCVIGIAALFVSLWVERGRPLTLPSPSGPSSVGRIVYDWKDDRSTDPLAPTAGTARELLVWIWYPAGIASAPTTDDYVPTYVKKAVANDTVSPIFKLLTRNLANVHAHSIPNSSITSQEQSHPVLIMRGGASAEVWRYSTLAEDLSSHGYVVVGFDAPSRTNLVAFPDGRVATRLPANNPEQCFEMSVPKRTECAEKLLGAWTSDISFVLDRLQELNQGNGDVRFTGHLDLTRVGVFGHSFGGAAALEFCHEDSRCRAVVDIDGAPHGNVIQAGLDRPLMILLSDHTHESDPEAHQIMDDLQSIYDRAPSNARQFIAIRGANHFLFSDDGALLKSHLVMGSLRTVGIVGIDGRRQLTVTSYCLRSFFDAFLKGSGNSTFTLKSPLYPEIQFVR